VLTVAPLAVPPADTFATPLLSTVALTERPPDSTARVTPLLTAMLFALP
jgi:hypothetical protein